MRIRPIRIVVMMVVLVLGVIVPWRALAQNPSPQAKFVQVPRVEWNLSDLLEGMLKLESAGVPLSHAQAETLRPALERVLKAMQLTQQAESQIKHVLTPDQVAYITEQYRSDQLRLDAGLGPPRRPGQDPVLDKAIEILEKRAR